MNSPNFVELVLPNNLELVILVSSLTVSINYILSLDSNHHVNSCLSPLFVMPLHRGPAGGRYKTLEDVGNAYIQMHCRDFPVDSALLPYIFFSQVIYYYIR